MKKSRLRAKGRRESTLELIEWVMEDYYNTRVSMADIGQISRVSTGTVSKILDGKYYVIVYNYTDTNKVFKAEFWWCDRTKCILGVVDGMTYSMEQIKQNYGVVE